MELSLPAGAVWAAEDEDVTVHQADFGDVDVEVGADAQGLAERVAEGAGLVLRGRDFAALELEHGQRVVGGEAAR